MYVGLYVPTYCRAVQKSVCQAHNVFTTRLRLIDNCDSSGEPPTGTTPVKVTRGESAILNNRCQE